MIVRLTAAQVGALDKALDGSPLGPWFGNDVEMTHAGHTQFDCRTIPDFWVAAADHVIRHHLSPGSARPRTATLAAAVKRVVTETNRYRTHPAFRGECVLGDQSEWLPCWYDELGDERLPFIPSGIPPADRVLIALAPRVSRHGPQLLTCWEPSRFIQAEDPVLLDSTYERFRLALGGPASAPARQSSTPAD